MEMPVLKNLPLFLKLLLIGVVLAAAPVLAQQSGPSNIFESKMRAANAVTLMVEKRPIKLWGVDKIENASAAFKLKSRTALDNIIGGKKVQCEIKSQKASETFAQCVNTDDLDLSLFVLQQGYATVDRSKVYGTVFESAYIQAEIEAQDRSRGIWAVSEEAPGGRSGSSDSGLILSFSFILFLCIIAVFTVLSIIIMRGFQKVIDAQNHNASMMEKERKLRDKERGIVATMLDSELKVNKTKIEAYLVVYEEMLMALKDPEKTPKYKKAGDIVQMQPALDRAVFDGNTDKLDVLGRRLASELIHFYARIKSKPEYENIEPEMELQDAIAMLENAIKNARRLDSLSEDLIKSFSDSGVMQEKPQE